MKPAPEKFEDRKGSNYELGRDRSSRPSTNEIKFVDRKEEQQRKKYGIKPTDTNIDVANLIARDVLTNVIKEEPSQEAQQMTKPDDDFDEEEKKKEDKIFDPKEELRIKMMQYLNPRILKSKELKDYMKRTNVNEAIGARLNDIATEKLDLYKKAIAINAPVELNERIKSNKEKSKNIARQIGANAFISRKVDTMQSPLIAGREVMSNPEISSQQVSDLYNKLPNPLEKSPATMVADHQALHTLHEEEQLDEAKRNPNVIKQGRTKIVKARVRGGKVQRKKRVSAVKGFTIRGGKLKRMSMAERLRRKRGQRRGKIKRKAKMARALMRRKRSMRRRASLGLKE